MLINYMGGFFFTLFLAYRDKENDNFIGNL